MHTRLLRLAVLLVALGCVGACRPQVRARATTRLAATKPATRPVRGTLIDFRKGVGSFPLAKGREVKTAGGLEEAMREGYLERMTPAKPDFITLRGPMDSLRLLKVDASYGRVRGDYRPAAFDKSVKTQRVLTVRRLEYVADPLSYDVAAAKVSLTADEARLELLQDGKGVRGLVLTGAKRGRFEFHAGVNDLNQFAAVAPRDKGVSQLTISRTTFAFKSPDPHRLEAEVNVRARWVLLPMTFRVKGKVATTEEGVLTFSDLSAEGYDPGGVLAAGFISKVLRKMEGESRRVVSFPDSRTHVTDVRFEAGEGVGLVVEFGR